MVYHLAMCATYLALLITNQDITDKHEENEVQSQRIKIVTLFRVAQQQLHFRMLLPAPVFATPPSRNAKCIVVVAFVDIVVG